MRDDFDDELEEDLDDILGDLLGPTIQEQIIKFTNKLYEENKSESFLLSKNEMIEKINKLNFFSKGDVWSRENNEDLFLKELGKDVKFQDQRYKRKIDTGIFGLSSGIYINDGQIHFIYDKKVNPNFQNWSTSLLNINEDYTKYIKNDFKDFEPKNVMGRRSYRSYPIKITDKEKEFLIKLFEGCYLIISEKERVKNIEKKKSDEVRGKLIEKLEVNKLKLVEQFDKDKDGNIDLIDGESLNKLLNKHQKSIIEIDKNYIQKFVKISQYLKTKKRNTQLIFESINEIQYDKKGNFLEYENELEELSNLLKNQIHTYELLIFHSISMITSLVESDLITFYEIYESFDQLGVFNSNWENEVSNKLSDIGNGIKELMYSINSMEDKIVHSLDNLTYMTQESFSELNNSITSQLGSIDSSIQFNNLLTGIQTYQMYKINKNTKRIN